MAGAAPRRARGARGARRARRRAGRHGPRRAQRRRGRPVPVRGRRRRARASPPARRGGAADLVAARAGLRGRRGFRAPAPGHGLRRRHLRPARLQGDPRARHLHRELVRRGIYVAPFDELSEPALVADLAARAEARGWEGFFVWDHVTYREPVRAVADPWITLAAVALATERAIIGPLVTPLPRRRPHQLARETVTLDRLSGGGLVLRGGVRRARHGGGEPPRFGEAGDPRERARLLDDGLERLRAYWDG